MNRRNALLLKILIFLFALNSVSIFLYFTSHSSKPFRFPNHSRPRLRRPLLVGNHESHFTHVHTHTHFLKPWPILPSYLPWSQSANTVPLRSCEAYFGNGFTRQLDVLSPNISAGGNGWFRCWYSETLRSSICEGGRLRMVPDRIVMSRGGETLQEVIGRTEEDELPVFQDGAFEIVGRSRKGIVHGEKKLVSQDFLDQYLPEGEILRHTMRDLIGSIRVVEEKEFACDEVMRFIGKMEVV